MNFEKYSIQRFKVGIDFHQRIYRVVKKNNGKIDLVNTLNGKLLMRDIDPATITIEDEPMRDLAELQDVVFNNRCLCEDEADDIEMTIFDLSFDKTFE